jgi:hypothetical protein
MARSAVDSNLGEIRHRTRAADRYPTEEAHGPDAIRGARALRDPASDRRLWLLHSGHRDLDRSGSATLVKGALYIGTEAHPYSHRSSITLTGHPISATGSLAELDASMASGYFYDAGGQTMYVRLVVQASKNYATIFIDPM